MPNASTEGLSRLYADVHLPATLSFIAGMVDVTSWLTLSGLFAAHITGNLVVIAADIVRGGTPHPSQVLAIPMFVVAVVASDLIAQRLGTLSRASSMVLLTLQCALLCGTLLIGIFDSNEGHPSSRDSLAGGMLAVSAMAVQNALLHLTRKKAPTTAVMTGNLVVATIALMDILRSSTRGSGKKEWEATWPLLAGFLAGCLVGSADVRFLGTWSWAIPTAVSFVYVLWFALATRTLKSTPSKPV